MVVSLFALPVAFWGIHSGILFENTSLFFAIPYEDASGAKMIDFTFKDGFALKWTLFPFLVNAPGLILHAILKKNQFNNLSFSL